MPSSNKTDIMDLSQFIATDKPTYLGDYNGDMKKIDDFIKALQIKLNGDIENLSNEVLKEVNALLSPIQTILDNTHNTANNALTSANSAQTSANGAMTLANQLAERDFIVEQNINTNGSYEKWNSGKLICRGKKNLGTISTTANSGGNRYVVSSPMITYPVPFVGEIPFPQIEVSTGADLWVGRIVSPTLTHLSQLVLFSFSAITNVNVEIGWEVTGKWK